jgi:glycerol-3-phosphate acyltransferase PlsX
VGVLSNGEEETKGNDLTRDANELLKKSLLNYIGYCEGKDVFAGDVDIVVCDGFVGNVLLKVAEGIADSMIEIAREYRPFSFLFGYLIAKNIVNFKKRVDTRSTGSPLLGVDKMLASTWQLKRPGGHERIPVVP